MDYKYLINMIGTDAIEVWMLLLLLKHFRDKCVMNKMCI
jgi:hypothetical protein